MQSMQSVFHGVREYLTPVLQSSSFKEKGVLTPEEFVQAGDQLVYKCPTWQWETGDENYLRSYLPKEKQFLITRNVPCRRRVRSLEEGYVQETEIADGEASGWLETHTHGSRASDNDEVDDISSTMQNISVDPKPGNAISMDLASAVVDEHFSTKIKTDGEKKAAEPDEYADMATFEEENLMENDDATLPSKSSGIVRAEEPEDTIVRTRTYDISITYDKYYQTPRVWLFGYDEHGRPLHTEMMFEDIMQDYANRTVTIESHPHLTIPHASIHPCQHAAVMKRIVDCLGAGGKEARTDQYLFIFLKFVQSVIPTIDYDYTMEVEAKA